MPRKRAARSIGENAGVPMHSAKARRGPTAELTDAQLLAEAWRNVPATAKRVEANVRRRRAWQAGLKERILDQP